MQLRATMLKAIKGRNQALWTPSRIANNLAMWFDAFDTASITVSSGKVTQWNDKSGNLRHATQAVSANQPTYVANDALANNRPSISIPSDLGTIGLETPSSSYREVFCVAYYGNGAESVASNTTTLISSPTNSFGYERIIVLGAQSALLAYSAGANFTGTVYKNGDTVGTATLLPLPSTVMRFARDDGNQVTQTTTLLTTTLTANRNFRGAACEFIFVADVLTLDIKQRIEGYLAWKWGLQGSLQAGHPYKNNPPVV